MAPTIHASAVLIGAHAVLIRGPSGSGKSLLALALLQAAERGALRFARLVADDRAHVEAAHGRLLVRPAPALAGMLEVRGVGIRRMAHEPVAVVQTVVELGQTDVERMPDHTIAQAQIEGITVPRLAVAPSTDALPAVLAYLLTHDRPG